jgi:hypothetical protein
LGDIKIASRFMKSKHYNNSIRRIMVRQFFPKNK